MFIVKYHDAQFGINMIDVSLVRALVHKMFSSLEGHPELSSFSRAYRAYAGRAAVRFSKMSFMAHCDFAKVSQNQHFQSTLFVEREVITK